jgi:hypothetical protein
MIALQS